MSREQKLEQALHDFVTEVRAYQSPECEECEIIGPLLRQADVVLSAPKAEAHPDDKAVDRFAEAMKIKLAQKRKEGRGGWWDDAYCSNSELSAMLREHVDKGDPLDVGNLAMMLHQRGERIAPAPKAAAKEPCPVCAKPFAAGDTCATDIELGKCHAECLADSPTVDLETGEPVDGPIDTFPHVAPKAEAVDQEGWPEPKVVNPDIPSPTRVAYLDCLLHRLLDAQQDINEAANEQMSQPLCDASSIMEEVEAVIRRLSTSPVPAITDEAVERMANWLSENFTEAFFRAGASREVVRGSARAALLSAFPDKGGE